MSTTQDKTPTKKQILKEIANDLREFDFGSFDPRKDKAVLMTHLQTVNSKLGKMIRKINEEEASTR
jgi:hypothetical protein